jgi:outer membrane protease
MDAGDVLHDDRYLFVSPIGMQQIMTDNTATSADYNSLRAIDSGQFPTDATFYGYKWRMSNKLPIVTANIRQCIAVQAMGVGYSVGLVQSVSVSQNPERWNNWQAIIKLSAAAVRIDDACVIQIDIDETK